MDPNQTYSAAEVERMMKLQDVLLKAMAKKMCWFEAAEIIRVSERTMRRWRERLCELRSLSRKASPSTLEPKPLFHPMTDSSPFPPRVF